VSQFICDFVRGTATVVFCATSERCALFVTGGSFSLPAVTRRPPIVSDLGDEISSEFDTVRRTLLARRSHPLSAALDIRCRGNRDVSAPAACVYFDWSNAGLGEPVVRKSRIAAACVRRQRQRRRQYRTQRLINKKKTSAKHELRNIALTFSK